MIGYLVVYYLCSDVKLDYLVGYTIMRSSFASRPKKKIPHCITGEYQAHSNALVRLNLLRPLGRWLRKPQILAAVIRNILLKDTKEDTL